MGKKRRRFKDLLVEIRDGTDSAKIEKYLDDMRCDVNQRSKTTGATPLMIASEKAKSHVVEILLKHKACLIYRDSFGDTAFHYLCRPNQQKWSKKIKTLLLLLKANDSAIAILTRNDRGTSAISGLYSVARLGKNMAKNDRERERACTVEALLKTLDPKEGGSLPTYESEQQEYWSQKLGMAEEDDAMDSFGRMATESADVDVVVESNTTPDSMESDAAYCTRIRREMQAKRQRQHEHFKNGPGSLPSDAPQLPPWLHRDGLSEKMKERERQQREDAERLIERQKAETIRLQASARAEAYQSAAKTFFSTMAQQVRLLQLVRNPTKLHTQQQTTANPTRDPAGSVATGEPEQSWKISSVTYHGLERQLRTSALSCYMNCRRTTLKVAKSTYEKNRNDGIRIDGQALLSYSS
eukprot:m.232126 g.232126  ORF g.232126 m.232126 type:complete len:411 (-) comp19269_c0_seq1:344-1576(-)